MILNVAEKQSTRMFSILEVSVHISALRQAIVIYGFGSLPQTLEANDRMVYNTR